MVMQMSKKSFPLPAAVVGASPAFTLIEAVVTAVIVAILAAVGLGLYQGYVKEARQDTVNQIAQTAAAAANTYYRKTNKEPTSYTDLNLFLPDPTRYSVSVDNTQVTVKDEKYGITKKVTYK
jgi:type II secretory pathway pseudopilin PulG